MPKAKVHPLPVQKPAQLSEEEKKQQVMRFLAQKREQIATGVLFNICGSGKVSPLDVPEELAHFAVATADAMLKELYPVQEPEKDDVDRN